MSIRRIRLLARLINPTRIEAKRRQRKHRAERARRSRRSVELRITLEQAVRALEVEFPRLHVSLDREWGDGLGWVVRMLGVRKPTRWHVYPAPVAFSARRSTSLTVETRYDPGQSYGAAMHFGAWEAPAVDEYQFRALTHLARELERTMEREDPRPEAFRRQA